MKTKTINKSEYLKKFSELDQPGNKTTLALGINESGNVVSLKFKCDKEKCRCNGTWTNGNEEEATNWLWREDFNS